MIIGLYRDDNRLTILNLEYNGISVFVHGILDRNLGEGTTITFYQPDDVSQVIQGERVMKLYSTSKLGNAFAWGRLNQIFRYIDNKENEQG